MVGLIRQREKSVFIELPLFPCCILLWAQSGCVLLRVYSRGHCFPFWGVQPWIACPGQKDSWDGGGSPGFSGRDILAVRDIISACVCTCAAAQLTAGAQLVCMCKDSVLGGGGVTAV